MKRGKLEIIYGNMFSNKTGTLIHKIDTLRKYGKKSILVLKPSIDTRSGAGYIKNSEGKQMEATEIPADRFDEIFNVINTQRAKQKFGFDMIAIDEIQFFEHTDKVYLVINELLESGYDMIVAGLALNFKGEPFGVTLQLIGLCESIKDVTNLFSYCSVCGMPATLPQRLINGNPAPYDSDVIKVGGEETYQARCYEHHELPGKQKPL